ncbi:adenosine deaminase family protein [Actinomadura madurae]|uniref:adenosine deaminase family protein n=1 Tax=Actinomadura madurae TaxID=1993 RepID=UPI003999B6B4
MTEQSGASRPQLVSGVRAAGAAGEAMAAAGPAVVARLARLPKADLHLHLETAMRWTTLATLRARAGEALPSRPVAGVLEDFEPVRAAVAGVLRAPERWARLADEVLSDYLAQGVVHLEPSFVARNYRGAFPSDEHCWMHVLETFGAAAERHGVSMGFMAAVDRVRDTPESALELARLAVRLRPYGMTSFGLHSQEMGYPGDRFAAAFRAAKDGGLLVTPHAGEFAGPASLREALDTLGADRIQHGVRAGEDADLLARLAEERVCLDVCPTSNVVLGVVPSIGAHPLPHLMRAGVPCSLAADDPIWFDTSILGEYVRCAVELGLDDAGLAALAQASITYSAAPPAVKDAASDAVADWLAASPEGQVGHGAQRRDGSADQPSVAAGLEARTSDIT